MTDDNVVTTEGIRARLEAFQRVVEDSLTRSLPSTDSLAKLRERTTDDVEEFAQQRDLAGGGVGWDRGGTPEGLSEEEQAEFRKARDASDRPGVCPFGHRRARDRSVL